MSNQTVEEDEVSIMNRRIQRLRLQLEPTINNNEIISTSVMEMERCKGGKKTSIDVKTEALSDYMRGEYREIQEKVYEYFKSKPHLQTPIEISKDDQRELCMKQLMGLVREGGIKPFRYVVEEPAKYFAILEAVGGIDMSLGIKM